MQLVPYLSFGGKCKEAMEFYKSIIGGELTIQTVGESPMAAGVPPETHNSVLHSVLVIDGKNFLFASDQNDPTKTNPGNTVSLCLSGTKEEITAIFNKLLEGGSTEHPLKEEFFGMFGDLTDKYGFKWMVQSDPEKKA